MTGYVNGFLLKIAGKGSKIYVIVINVLMISIVMN